MKGGKENEENHQNSFMQYGFDSRIGSNCVCGYEEDSGSGIFFISANTVAPDAAIKAILHKTVLVIFFIFFSSFHQIYIIILQKQYDHIPAMKS